MQDKEIKEKRRRRRKQKQKVAENVDLEEEEDQELPTIVDENVQDVSAKPKKEKRVAFREELSTIEILSDSNDELLDNYDDNLAQEQVSLKPSLKKLSKREPETSEDVPDDQEFKKETQVITSSQAVRRLRKQLLFDDSRPLPDLEIISQKRLLEGINKVAEENVIEEKQMTESKTQISSKSLLEKHQVKTTVANIRPPKFIQKLQPVVSEPQHAVVLKGEVDGNPFPDIKWFFNENELFNSERYEMIAEKTNVALKIKSVEESDIGIYT